MTDDETGDDELMSIEVLDEWDELQVRLEQRGYQWELLALVDRAGALPALAAPFDLLHLGVLVAGGLGSLVVLARWRRDRALAGFAFVVLTGLAANALVTGGLSRPHHRYQARIAWLVVLPPVFALMLARPGGAGLARGVESC